MYKVTLEGSNEGQKFLFTNYDDALTFISIAVDHGTFMDYDYVDGKRVYKPSRPIKVIMQGVDE